MTYEPYKSTTHPMACTFKAAERLVAIRTETIRKGGSEEHEPRSLAEALGTVLKVRQKTGEVSPFATDPDGHY